MAQRITQGMIERQIANANLLHNGKLYYVGPGAFMPYFAYGLYGVDRDGKTIVTLDTARNCYNRFYSYLDGLSEGKRTAK